MLSRRRGTTWPGRFRALTTGSPVGVFRAVCLRSGCQRLRVSDLCRTLESGGCRLAFLFCNTGHKPGSGVIRFTSANDLSGCVWRTGWRGREWKQEAQSQALQQWEPGVAAAGLREEAETADRRGRRWLDWEPALNVEWMRPVPCVRHLQIHLDSVCMIPLCLPPPLLISAPSRPSSASCFVVTRSGLCVSYPGGFLTGPLLASSQGRCYCLCFTGRHQDPDSLNEWPWSPGP